MDRYAEKFVREVAAGASLDAAYAATQALRQLDEFMESVFSDDRPPTETK